MKKLLFVFAMLFATMSFAQFSAGTSFIGVGTTSPTGMNFSTVRDSGVRNYQVGLEGGHFLVNKLAVVAGAGYNVTRVKDVGTTDEAISYKAGFKYYVENVLPVQVDYNGVDNLNYVGTELGWAFKLANNFTLEPKVRYDFALKNEEKDRFTAGFGFNYFFK